MLKDPSAQVGAIGEDENVTGRWRAPDGNGNEKRFLDFVLNLISG